MRDWRAEPNNMLIQRAIGLDLLRALLRWPYSTHAPTRPKSWRDWLSFEGLHRTALRLRTWPAVPALYRAIYALAERVFVHFCLRVNRQMGKRAIRAIYLRRGGGRGELLPGASDLDFFLLLEELSAAEEMVFLKEFWDRFRAWKRVFPFLGETLMGDRNELANWVHTPTVRAFEAAHSWRRLWGEPALEEAGAAGRPLLRDVFSECAKCYWALLHPILREESLDVRAHEPRALKFRNAAKGALDLFRMHYTFHVLPPEAAAERDRFWTLSRAQLTESLPREIYGEGLERLRPLLELREPLPRGEELFLLFSRIIHRAFRCVDELAERLGREAAAEEGGFRHFEPRASGTKVLQSGNQLGKDHYSLSVREVFAERMILRNREWLRRTLVSDETAHMVFPFFRVPEFEPFHQVLVDLRVASTSFNQSSVALPVTEATLRELERSSFLDSPFHAFHDHQETRLGDDGHVRSSAYQARPHELPENVLRKTFAEASLAIRFQPPPDFIFLVENLVKLVLQLRVAEETGEIATDFYSALAGYAERHPLRAQYLKDQMGKYLNLCNEEEDRFWGEVSRLVDELGSKHPHRASLLRAQVDVLKNRKYDVDWKLKLATTDLWVEITPFLRLEMNSLRDRYFPARSLLKL